jgi:hypothetical protein
VPGVRNGSTNGQSNDTLRNAEARDDANQLHRQGIEFGIPHVLAGGTQWTSIQTSMELVQGGWGRSGKANPTRSCRLPASWPAAGNASGGIREGAAACRKALKAMNERSLLSESPPGVQASKRTSGNVLSLTRTICAGKLRAIRAARCRMSLSAAEPTWRNRHAPPFKARCALACSYPA